MDKTRDLVASLIELLASRSLDLLLIASAADVISADARFNHWIAVEAKQTLSSDTVLKIIGEYEDATVACRSAIEKFATNQDSSALQKALTETLVALGRHRVK
jgi:hypothetical protein